MKMEGRKAKSLDRRIRKLEKAEERRNKQEKENNVMIKDL